MIKEWWFYYKESCFLMKVGHSTEKTITSLLTGQTVMHVVLWVFFGTIIIVIIIKIR